MSTHWKALTPEELARLSTKERQAYRIQTEQHHKEQGQQIVEALHKGVMEDQSTSSKTLLLPWNLSKEQLLKSLKANLGIGKKQFHQEVSKSFSKTAPTPSSTHLKEPKFWLGYLVACLPIAALIYFVLKGSGGEIDSFRLLIGLILILVFGGINFVVLWGYFEYYNNKLDEWHKMERRLMGEKFLKNYPNSYKVCKECGGTIPTKVLVCKDCGHGEPVET